MSEPTPGTPPSSLPAWTYDSQPVTSNPQVLEFTPQAPMPPWMEYTPTPPQAQTSENRQSPSRTRPPWTTRDAWDADDDEAHEVGTMTDDERWEELLNDPRTPAMLDRLAADMMSDGPIEDMALGPDDDDEEPEGVALDEHPELDADEAGEPPRQDDGHNGEGEPQP